MIREPEIALVFSPEPWVETLHRHLADHGGARVRQIVLDPSLALEEAHDVLVVSHRWPALTSAFVDALHQKGRMVLGVFDPLESQGARYLSEVDVDRSIASGAPMSEFLEALQEMISRPGSTRSDGSERYADDGDGRPGNRGVGEAVGTITVVSGPAGSGVTEIAIGLAHAFGRRGETTILIDADDVSPSVAPRLGLPIEPNLRNAVDALEYRIGSLDEVATAHAGGFGVISGIPTAGAWSQVRAPQIEAVVIGCASRHAHVVVNAGPCLEDLGGVARGRYASSRMLMSAADVIVGVGIGGPVGVVRLLQWLGDVRLLAAHVPVHLVINRAPSDAFRRREVETELQEHASPASVSFVGYDRKVAEADWSGELVSAGPFARSIEEVANRTAGASVVGREFRARKRVMAGMRGR